MQHLARTASTRHDTIKYPMPFDEQWQQVPFRIPTRTRPGLCLTVTEKPRASFNKTLGEALNGRAITWAVNRDGRVGFAIEVEYNKHRASWKVLHQQCMATPLKRLGIKPGTRLWFEFDDQTCIFVEVAREDSDQIRAHPNAIAPPDPPLNLPQDRDTV